MENNFIENEHKILKFWEELGFLGKLKEKNKNGQPWSFLDGPITANNPMGVHHAWGRSLKDLFQRFKAMQGFEQRLQNGFDCQGLWVEVEVEKELGFKSKKDIETYGIEKFVNKCKERAHKYSKIQTEQSIRLGMLRDWGNWQTDFDEQGEWIKQSHSYYTLSDENNYAIWHFLKICHEKKYLYKGRDVVPWCPRCGTAISQHEILTEEYKEITHKAVYVKFSVVGQDNTYLLAWTTTPWTLPGNVVLAVQPDFDYVKIKKNNEVYILLKEKANLVEGGEIIEEIKGKELEGMEYQGIFDDLPSVARCKRSLTECNRDGEGEVLRHKVVLWKEVTAEDGTGIVHSAPGCGAEDFQLAKTEGLPVIDLTDNESNYREGFGELSGKFVGAEQARQWIFNNLESKGLVYKIEDYKHRYPTCWRCKAELIFRVVDEWYISMDKLREPLMKAVEKINWLPGFCKERELDWLKNMHDWLISKKRYWGLCLPIWECLKCYKDEGREDYQRWPHGDSNPEILERRSRGFEVIGSLEELKQRAVEGWQDFTGHSPHRPWVDNVKIKCHCGELMSRVTDVGTPWLDAGIVPFSTISDDNRSADIPYFHNKRDEWQKWFPAELVCEGFPGQFKNWFYVLLVMSQVLENEPPFKNLLGFANVVDEKGEEMHKSKGNAIWFDEGVERIGADVMRWMYAKQNPANDMRFGYNAAKETERKILTLINCLTFFSTYVEKKVTTNYQLPTTNLTNILDRWILSKLNNLIKKTTESLEKFDSTKASQAVEDFWINDLSLWYVRRSRKRFQNPESQEDKELAEQTFYYVLLTIAKLIAPFMPFLAEEIYQQLKSGTTPESIHLCEWPAFVPTGSGLRRGKPEAEKKFIDEKLEQEMQVARDVVSLALAKRMDLKIGVRQALAMLKFKLRIANCELQNEILDLIKDEVNVKKVIFDENIKDEVELDTTITDELKEEGQVREIIRHIQDLRKKAGLTPQDKVSICFVVQGSLAKVIAKNQKQILEITKSQAFKENSTKQGEFLAQKEVKIDIVDLWLAIERF